MPILSTETLTAMRYLLLPFTRRYVTYAGALVAAIVLLVLSFSNPVYWFPCGCLLYTSDAADE